MSTSAQLRKSHTSFGGGAIINNEVAKNFESKLKNIRDSLVEKLKEEYPSLKFELLKRVYKKEIHKKLNVPFIGGYYENDTAYIQPDGGMILANGIPIFVGEAKRQGTNVERAIEGLPPQSQGNAIERAFKNIKEIELIMLDQPHFPYALFCFGCDFNPGSTIIDRLLAATYIILLINFM